MTATACSLASNVSGLIVSRAFHDPEEACEYAAENSFDAAFLDITMPRISGMQLIGELRKHHPSLPIVLVTGYEEYAVQAFSGDSVYVVLDTGVAVGQVVRIAYAPGTTGNRLTDQSSNAAAAFGARDVENGLDSVMSKPREGNVYYSTMTLYYPGGRGLAGADTEFGSELGEVSDHSYGQYKGWGHLTSRTGIQ